MESLKSLYSPTYLRTLKFYFLSSPEPVTGTIVSQLNLVHTHAICLKYILILSFRIRLDLSNGLFPFGFLTKILYEFLIPSVPAVFCTHLLCYLMAHKYLMKSTNYDGPLKTFPSLLLPPLCHIEIILLAPVLEYPQSLFFRLTWQMKFHIHVKQILILYALMFTFLGSFCA